MPKLDEITSAKVDKLDDITLAMLALGPSFAISNCELPLHDCIALSEDPRISKLGEKVFLLAVFKLAKGFEVSPQVRALVSLWAQLRLWSKPKRSGRPNSRAKAVAVRMAYEEKIEKDPRRKREAIIRELEQEFGLKRRRILAMIEVVDQRAVRMTYEEKIEKDPRRKREALIRELEQEFGLKHRRILAMIDEVDQRVVAQR